MNALCKGILAGEKPPFEAWKETLVGYLPWFSRLKDTPQDPVWHGEGDVESHTRSVLDQVYAQFERHSPEDRLVLVLAALLHDIGKPQMTRQREDGRWISPHHADRGRSYLALRLLELQLPWSVYARVLGLVGHHHDPAHLVRQGSGRSSYARLTRLSDTRLLYDMEQADFRGRIAPDLDDQLDVLELFRLSAEEHGCWNENPYLEWRSVVEGALNGFDSRVVEATYQCGLSAYESGLIFTPQEALSRGFRFRKPFPELFVTCGISASGKSQWIQDHLPGFEVISLDALRAELSGDSACQSDNGKVLQLAKERLKDALRKNKSVVWDATNVKRVFRQLPLGLGFDYGAFVTLVVFAVSEKICQQRNQTRDRSVAPGVLAQQVESFDFPYGDEAHRVYFVDQSGDIAQQF